MPSRAEVEIRLAAAEDVATLIDVEVDSGMRFVDSVHPELASGETVPAEVLERAIAGGRIFVATLSGEVVGWVLLIRSDGELCVGQISVRTSAGRRGIGTQLLEFVIAHASAQGERSIVLNTQADVAWNQPWYERHGFRVVEPADWTSDMHVVMQEQLAEGLDWDTRVHMRLDLTT